MSKFLQKWIAIVALALMPAVVCASACAAACEPTVPGTAQSITSGGSPCDDGQCIFANLCDLAHSVFIDQTNPAAAAASASHCTMAALAVLVPAEPQPPLKPPLI